jgi:type II secretory pathway component PulK
MNILIKSKKNKRLKKAFFLVVVLSSVSLLTAVVTQMTSSVSRSGVILSDVKNSILADSLCDSTLEIVKRILQDDLSRGRYDFYSEDFTSEEELWSKTYILPVDILYGKVRVIITDENAKFNVNALVDSQGKTEAVARQSYLKVFQKFLKIMKLDERFAGYIQDWIDFDSEGIFEIPHQSRNWFIPYPEEFLFLSNLVKIDVSSLASDYFEGRPDATGYPYITFWPYAGALKINVNTAPKEIIASFIDKDDALDIADKIVKERKNNPFKTFSEFLVFLSKLVPLLPENFFNLRPEMIFDIGSEIFSVKIFCESQGVQSGLQAVIMRGTTEQSFETLFFRRF